MIIELRNLCSIVAGIFILTMECGLSASPCLVVVALVEGQQPVRTLNGHSDGIREVVFSHDGKLLASAGDDATVRIWNAATGAELHTLRGHGKHRVSGVAFSPDGTRLASAGWDQKVVLWNTSTGNRERVHKASGGGELDRVGIVLFE